MKQILLIVLCSLPCLIMAQTNCSLFKDEAHKSACELYWKAIEYNQGSRESQELFVQSLKACPTYGPSLHEMSVPYLKRGDFFNWKQLMDRAVAADPIWLSDRGWCLFKFLRDYKNSFADLKRLYDINKGQPGYSGDGDYNLRIIMALNQRAMGNLKASLAYFNECITDHEKKEWVGLFDYLHLGVTRMMLKDYKGAIADLNRETKKYEKLADTYYYLGLCYKKLGQDQKAYTNFTQAKELFTKTGYYRNDPYCEVPDQVYLSDIEDELKKFKN
ncbi:tetratricopeptide repeat protein [Mucilaginibacter sp. JC4]|uniref:Tetratricopeptide repeat protein n=2 Tax=Mucilaginibacter aquariorum TaxID=2967225 RepID=A0ABT1T618_9SPHI|nr:tetratricopeptide repeat protein [Mucilaginibacter aquariorum]